MFKSKDGKRYIIHNKTVFAEVANPKARQPNWIASSQFSQKDFSEIDGKIDTDKVLKLKPNLNTQKNAGSNQVDNVANDNADDDDEKIDEYIDPNANANVDSNANANVGSGGSDSFVLP